MFCPECGHDARDSRFCPECGTGLDRLRPHRLDRGRSRRRGRRPAAPRTAHDRFARQEPVAQAGAAAAGANGALPAGSSRRAAAHLARRHLDGLRHHRGAHHHRRVRAHQNAVGRLRQLATSTQPSGPIAADTSGSYSQLVQRANGLYDQGAQAFQKKQHSAGEQYFAAAAKVYRAAWKQQPTDPNVGTDYATSLFYSGDGEAALKQVNAVLAKSPDFQTAHLNKGIYLQTASQAAQQSGNQRKADSLLAQAKAEFQRAVSIDPGSSAGAKAAENLKAI